MTRQTSHTVWPSTNDAPDALTEASMRETPQQFALVVSFLDRGESRAREDQRIQNDRGYQATQSDATIGRMFHLFSSDHWLFDNVCHEMGRRGMRLADVVPSGPLQEPREGPALAPAGTSTVRWVERWSQECSKSRSQSVWGGLRARTRL